MSYLPHTCEDTQTMYKALKVNDIEELLSAIPANLRLGRSLNLPEALSEYDLVNCLEEMASRNVVSSHANFLGAGAYRHFVPTIVDTVIERSEFLTAYTPYQAEASQGTLQAIFEFQSMICRLTGMDAANASVYDGGTAAVDAALMAVSQTRRQKILVSRAVHPQVRQLLKTYLAGSNAVIEEIPLKDGKTNLEAASLDKDTSCVLYQVPNFLGIVEDCQEISAKAKEVGALSIAYVGDAVSLALLKAPSQYGADLCCGDAQSLGLPLSFGGPFVGFLACKNNLLRKIPGRLVGMTEDHNGKRGFCLTLQAREQHIRREKASSNICSNQGLCALAATVHLSLLGPCGLKRAALGSFRAAHMLKKELKAVKDLEIVFSDQPSFHEFVVKVPDGLGEKLLHCLGKSGIVGGYYLGNDYPELKDCILMCATELTSPEDIRNFAGELSKRLGQRQSCACAKHNKEVGK